MLNLILIIITFLVLLAASYSDLKTREVPDLLNYGLIFTALGIRAIYSVELGWEVLASGLLGLAACFILASLFYYSHQWGGGDSKLLMGMGAIIGISYPFDFSSFNILLYFVTLLFVGAFYGILWLFYLAIKNKKIFLTSYKKKLLDYRILHFAVLIISTLFILSLFFVSSIWFFFIFPPIAFYLFILVSVVEEHFFIKKVDISKLTEGDWLEEEVVVHGKTIISDRTLEKKHLTLLNKLKEEGKINKVTIKEGIPFIPSFLFAYLILIYGSNIFNWIFQKLFI
jgi:Flp pilus assembly protein protease CpaA